MSAKKTDVGGLGGLLKPGVLSQEQEQEQEVEMEVQRSAGRAVQLGDMTLDLPELSLSGSESPMQADLPTDMVRALNKLVADLNHQGLNKVKRKHLVAELVEELLTNQAFSKKILLRAIKKHQR